jgi:hypothetical protein
MKQAYIVMRPAETRGFVHQEDRDYFSKPVLVEIVGEHGAGLLTVTDHRRGHTYPCDPKSLRSLGQLTRRQRAAAGCYCVGGYRYCATLDEARKVAAEHFQRTGKVVEVAHAAS